MKIISKHHDYYDAMIRGDTDYSYIYNRRKSDVDVSKLDVANRRAESPFPVKDSQIVLIERGSDLFTRNRVSELSTFLIGFCGKIYTGVVVTSPEEPGNKDYLYGDDAFEYIHSAINNKYSNKKTLAMLMSRLKEQETYSRLTKLFLQLKVPYFVLTSAYRASHKLTVNPVLKDYRFYKVFSIPQAYQEIRMFVENNLASDTEVDVPTGDDVVLAESKGYDKFSFRKDKKA